jgi:M6 family metalloprotease-like protein
MAIVGTAVLLLVSIVLTTTVTMTTITTITTTTTSGVVLALAPPHPDSGNDVHATHRALRGGGVLGGRVRGNSTTQLPVVPYGLLVNAALCEGLSDDACLELNDEFHRQTRKLNTGYTWGGYLKGLVLCVWFSNHVDRLLPTTEQLHVLFNAADPDPDLAPTGSAKQFIQLNSHGTLEIDFDIMPWKTTDNTEAYYSFNKSGVTRDFGQSTHSVLDQLEADGVDFSDYDANDDTKIDAIVIVHSGYQAEIGSFDCYTYALTINRIWSHAIPSPSNPWVSSLSGIAVDNYAVGAALRGVCHCVLVHEFLHLFGLKDLNDNSGDYIGHGLGIYIS